MSEYLTYLRAGQEIIEREKSQLALNVYCARVLGDSWNEIGAALGMSKQAARQRFGTVRERAAADGQTTIHDVLD